MIPKTHRALSAGVLAVPEAMQRRMTFAGIPTAGAVTTVTLFWRGQAVAVVARNPDPAVVARDLVAQLREAGAPLTVDLKGRELTIRGKP